MPEFQGNSDQEETFKFGSMLLEAGWMDSHAFVNGAATLQVRTLYVAHGSKIKVTIKDKEAKALETVEGFVYADFFRKQVALTAAHAPGIFFEAELPDHGLKAIGQKLFVKPAIRVYEPTWKDKATGKAVSEIKRGMDLQIEAKTENLPDGADARILIREQHGDHHGAHDVISIPVQVKANKLSLLWRFEYPQDTLQFSSQDERGRTEEKYAPPKIFFEAWAYGACAKVPPADFIDFVVVEATDSAGNPAPDQKVKITLPDGTSQEATTDSEGLVKVAATKPGQVDVELIAQAPPAEESEAPPPAPKPQDPAIFVLQTSPWPTKPVVVPFTPNASVASCLQPKLDAHAPFKKAIKEKKLCFAVADLAHGGARYFGVNDHEQWNTASLAKIATMAAAFYLKAAVEAAAKEIAADATASAEITTDKQLFKALSKAWDPLIKAKFPRRAFTAPRLDKIFAATDTGSGWDIQFKEVQTDMSKVDAAHGNNGKIDKLGFKERLYLMVAFSDNWAAHTCIDDLGFNYIGGALQEAGFYDGDKTGFWTRSNYNGVKWGPAIGSGQAEAVCRFLCALQMGLMVDPVASNAMLALMEKAPNSSGIGSWILDVLPDRPDELYSKVGVWNGHYSEGVVVLGSTLGGTAFKYALIIYQHLGSEEFMIETLAPEIHSCLTGAPVAKKPSNNDELTEALRLMETEAFNFASNYINDASVRVNYNRKIKEMSGEIQKAVSTGEMTLQEGAETANNLRNGIMDETRAQTSSVGRAHVEAEKKSGRTMEELLEKYAGDKFGQRRFIELTLDEKREVFSEIIKSSGRPSPKYTAKIPKLRLLGRACLIATVSISAFNIWKAQNKIAAGMREGLVFGGGALGGALAGASIGLVCGPGAPACATVLFVIGGLAGAVIADTAGAHYEKEIEEIAEWLD